MQAARRRAGLTQDELAERVSFSVSHLRGLERGAKRWNEDHLVEVAAALGISLRELLPPGELDSAAGRAAYLQQLEAALDAGDAVAAFKVVMGELERRRDGED